MGILRSYWRLPWGQKAAAVRVSLMVLGVRAALQVLPYRTVQRWLAQGARDVSSLAPEVVHARRRRIVSLVAATSKHLLGDKPCLTQALVAQRLLRQQGYDTELRIGVTKDGEELLAHAWLEREGQVVIGGQSSQGRYVPLVPVHPEVV